MCDSRRPLNGADSEDHCTTGGYPEYPEQTNPYRCIVHEAYWSPHALACSKADTLSEPPTRPVWLSRAVNGGWDTSAVSKSENGAQSLLEASTLRLVAA